MLEKVFVHTDKWFYIAAETIWFKAYCINAFSHRLSCYSKTLFIDLVNDKDSVISQLLVFSFSWNGVYVFQKLLKVKDLLFVPSAFISQIAPDVLLNVEVSTLAKST